MVVQPGDEEATMVDVAKRKKPDQPESSPAPERPPSRENTRYIAIPLDLYEALQRFAESRSDEDDKKSISWAGRVAIRKFLIDNDFWPSASGS